MSIRNGRSFWLLAAGLILLVLAGCTGWSIDGFATPAGNQPASPSQTVPLPVATPSPHLEVAVPGPSQIPAHPSLQPASGVETPPAIASHPPSLLPDFDDLAAETPPPLAVKEFPETDFSLHSVSYDNILSGGPPRDGIRPLDDPALVPVSEADSWLEPQEPVIFFQHGGQARAYPIQILIFHEIVNDVVSGLPVVVTFCPLCNTAIAFERRVGGQVLSFSTTGRLRFSNLIMYDRQSGSWWQQATGEAIVGESTGTRLRFLPATIISWQDFKDAHPGGWVLSRETGYNRPYGFNPYPGYDDINESPFLYDGPPTSDQLQAMARVLTVDLGGEAVAYPYELLSEIRLANDTVGGSEVLILWQPGVVSPLDDIQVFSGGDVGTAVAFSRSLDGQMLSFVFENGMILDEQTRSQWNVFGQAGQGPLAGRQLTPVVSINHFWFSWAAFKPETRIFGGQNNP